MADLPAPAARTCSWCGTVNTDPALTHCTSCGGPLPLPPGADPGPPPPPAPRQLPRGYRNRVLYWKNVLVIIGIVFTVPLFWTILFPLVGIPLWVVGRRRALAKLDALERGVPARAEITEVFIDGSVEINGRHPWVVAYTFQTADGRRIDGRVQGWEPSNRDRAPGQPLWAVYVPEDPERNAIWPPIR